MKATPSPWAAASRISWPESNMVDRRRVEAGHADRLAPFIEGLGQVAVEEDGRLGELGRVGHRSAVSPPPIATTRLLLRRRE